MTTKFDIDKDNKRITVSFDHWDELDEIEEWCDKSGLFEVYATGITYLREKDLMLFMLRWA